ncbi:MAG: hypothetical protein O2913_10080 [Chloroflexi bacterium]|nr:hypothetical protein [Chloroflexota bacterium]
MTSPKKQSANKKNAQLSKGPIDTSETRFNALRHGILSKESFIGVGDGREDAEEFSEFAAYLQESLSPVGGIEELLVDKLIGLTWRSRRLLRFETAAIRSMSDTAINDWEIEQERDIGRLILGKGPWQTKENLDSTEKRLKEDEKAFSQENPIDLRLGIWRSVFDFVSSRFELDIVDLLGLEESWEDYDSFSKEDIRKVVAAARRESKINEPQFWWQVKQYTRSRSQGVSREQERRKWDLDRVRLAASLPTEANLNKIQRYEAHLSREFYKALHELQRLQAARLILRPFIALAVDIDSSLTPSQEPE